MEESGKHSRVPDEVDVTSSSGYFPLALEVSVFTYLRASSVLLEPHFFLIDVSSAVVPRRRYCSCVLALA